MRRLAPLLALLAMVGTASADDKGYLTVTSTPAAHVFIDDVDTHLDTPATHVALTPGRHKVVLVAGATKRQLGVVITAGEEKKLNVNL